MRLFLLAAAIALWIGLAPASGDRAEKPEDAVHKVLDDFHDAAAKADGPRYFGHFAPGAVFLGTDASERWTLEEFRVFADPYFEKGKAWTYTPLERHVGIEGAAADVAWFDEKLDNAKIGLCRGSGALVKIDGVWRVKQYNLTMLVPNEIAEQVAKMATQAAPHASPAAEPGGK
jgi:hypothetical protein